MHPSSEKSTIVRTVARWEGERVVEAVFAGLSPQSRFFRFHTPVPTLTAGLRSGLLPIDGRYRAAVAAWRGDEPLGIARLAGDGQGCAEIAVAVVDAWQRRGLGTRLLTALTELADSIGYTELRGAILPENVAMQALAKRLYPIARRWFDGDAVQFTVPIGVARWTITEEDVLADLLTR